MVIDTLLTVATSAALTGMGDYAALYQGSIEPEFNYNAWNSHPYLGDLDFHAGSVCYDGNLYQDVKLRYNIYANQVIVLAPNSKLPVVPDQTKIAFFTMDGKKYVPRNGRFMRVAIAGKNLLLLACDVKTKGVDQEVNYHSIHTMEQTCHYYVETADGVLREVTKARRYEKLFPKYKRPMKKFRRSLQSPDWQDARIFEIVSCGQHLDDLLSPEDYPVASTRDLRPEQQSVYLTPQVEDSLWVAQVPDSVYRSVEPVTRVPAWIAYRMGSRVKLNYDDDEEMEGEAGIEDLHVLREEHTLKEVEVTAFRPKMQQAHSGMEAFTPKSLHNVPQVMGEADVLKLATMLPGVTTTGEAASGLNVRGGASEQNLTLYNSNTIFNPMHLFGLFSAFNPDLVKESEIYKGSIPSQYGGRLSSVMNIKGQIPDMQKYSGSVSIGLVNAKAVAELPVVKDRVSVIVGGRSTYSDWMLKRLPEKSGYKDGRAQFWDVGGKIRTRISDNQTLDVNAYYSHDRFSFTTYDKYAYQNMNFSAELRSRYNDRWSSYIAAGYDHYDYANDEKESPSEAARLSFDLNHYYLKAMTDCRWTESNTMNVGAEGKFYDICPGSYQPLGASSYIIGRTLKQDQAVEGALWLEDEWAVTEDLKLTGGLRMNLFESRKKEMQKTYLEPDLRFSISYRMGEIQSVKAGFNTLHQYIHKVSNTMIMSPTDSWMLSNEKINPQSGWQASFGYYLQSVNQDYEFSAELYYKGMDDYLTYRNAAQLSMNEHLEEDVMGMQGRAYGLELQVRKLTGKFTGWLSYTYSRTQLKQKEKLNGSIINGGDWYSADYDMPHNVKFVMNYKFTRRYSTSLDMNYSTGRPFTAPVGAFYSSEQQVYLPVYSDRNAVRMPDYFRTDWSFNIEPSHHLTAWTHRWLTIGVYNLFGRRNPYSIYAESGSNGVKAYKLSIFGAPIPYITYNIKF